MDNNNKARFAELMAWLAQTFKETLSSADIENYWRFLRIYPLADVEQAVLNYCRNPDGHRFMPKPGEIIAYIEGSSASQAMQAWAKVLKAVKQIGTYSTVIFDDAIIHAVLHDMGGWIKLCEMKEDEAPFRAREFEKRYIGYLINKPTVYPNQLTGLIQGTNSILGYESSEQAVIVGNEQRALEVYKSGKDAAKLTQFKPLSLELIKQLEQRETLAMEKKDE